MGSLFSWGVGFRNVDLGILYGFRKFVRVMWKLEEFGV